MGSDERALRPPEPPPSFIPFQIGGATCLGGLTGAAWATLRGKPIISTGLTVAAHTVGVTTTPLRPSSDSVRNALGKCLILWDQEFAQLSAELLTRSSALLSHPLTHTIDGRAERSACWGGDWYDSH